MRKTSFCLAAVLSMVVSTFAHAQGTSGCEIQYNRTACPGKETESYAKCDGKKTCVKPAAAASEQACREAALKACANDRLDVTASKEIKATYQGKPIKSASGQNDFCADYANRKTEFNQCATAKAK
ncbi:hypothetical protein [Caldimonas brevitalea]|uniref:Uncharacterized protein n=1 Tax=Caldimonas brevitalea TaxID=413882 RepID=A0A0G3BGZ5_9BURK|nr:hypothetical protein [Caldimonas brevitalea]AKJ28612.1 hypothetical protein AAW51_1921 [Caldimonas brevitalea]